MQATLSIDLSAIIANWRALDALSGSAVETGAVIKADAYGLGAAEVGPALAKAGVRRFFVAEAEEGVALRAAIGAEAIIYNFSGLMAGDEEAVAAHGVVPVLNSAAQVKRFAEKFSGKPCGVQLDSGMNRLGMEALEAASVGLEIAALNPDLVMSHLACADERLHPMNTSQLATFGAMTFARATARKSLSATGGILLGAPYHFDLTRPGIGLYGGLPFTGAKPVVQLDLPVVQVRDVMPGESVGYSAAWVATRPSKIATISSGYADGILRATEGFSLYAGTTPCPVVGRISMDLLTVDITDLKELPTELSLLNDIQTVDVLAEKAGTIGYEILTSLGSRYHRVYKGEK
ncbi:MAG: alanine racemase [Rhodobacteraceae bacterium]|nr:alanine racemase [Paracoccaceae bacterium]